MKTNNKNARLIALCLLLLPASCGIPNAIQKNDIEKMPNVYGRDALDTTSVNAGQVAWQSYFKDPHLVALIDTALKNNQELSILMQEISVAKNEVQARKGEYLPSVGLAIGAGGEKNGKKTLKGAMEETLQIENGKENPKPITDLSAGFTAHWELDIWRKLRNAKQASVNRYLATIEGRNFMQTNLIAEIANHYYELLALDQQLEILKENLEIQSRALEIIQLQKAATKVTELAVKKFKAEVFKNQSIQYELKQKVVEVENEINYLIGQYAQPIKRSNAELSSYLPDSFGIGIPVQLLENRPDIKKAALELEACKLDVKVAKANFYPSLGVSAQLGTQAYRPSFLLSSPESIFYKFAGDMVAPLLNRNGIKALYKTANNKQIQAAYTYEQVLVKAFTEVGSQYAKIDNMKNEVSLKRKQIGELSQSVQIANDLFMAARADYMEVLMTQRDALESKMEFVETEREQLQNYVNLYKSLGGGWR